LSATYGKPIWSHLARAAIWGSSPVVDGRLIFGDKSGWLYALSADDGKLISEIQIGENVDATPAIMNGRIYVGAFNGKFYCLK
jgi:outer membrane protein assembly factor BamB